MTDVFLTLVLFVLGFFVLIRGAQILVRGAVGVANIFKVSTWFIGAVIVSIGTSIPEFSINLASVLSGNDIGVATVVGSNIFNVLLVLGIMTLATPVVMHRSWIRRDLTMFVLVTLVASMFLLFPIFGSAGFYGISTVEAWILVALFVGWLANMIRKWDEAHENLEFEVITILTAVLMVAGGLVGVFIGGNWVVDGAIVLAQLVGVSPATIGLTVVALGTSLPELVVSLTALRHGTVGIATGNIVGSSIFNLLGVLGVTGLIQEIPIVETSFFVDVGFMVGAAFLWLLFMYVGKKYTLERTEGVFFLCVYVVFLITLFAV